MTRLRAFAAIALSLALVAGTSACSLIPGLAPDATGEPLIDTTWSGTDSDGDEWGLLFEDDGTVGLTYNGNEYDDATDTWRVANNTLTISIAFSEGVATMTGPYSDGATSVDLEGSQGAATWTLTITQD
ncbi:MAG: hypothetical protein KIT89_00575 [Microcella sp.]|uniref:hypothetical protein n=1 Tax=Microcella sp. TaxID=1913979 RepID=UPI0024C6D7A7|nr:hypothetical protein [Microcella sp.]UYN83778.1 MAG: hypothetical protein KIT89_00575 [Microcella sp.]